MQAIWKYPLEVADNQSFAMKKGADILCVQMQDNTPCLWARVDTKADDTLKAIKIFGTGHPLPDNPGRYIGTIQLRSDLVFHVFEEA